jgi:AAA domain
LFTAEQLQAMEFPPTSFLVRDVVPAEGVTLLCSKPKFGKSWLVYDLCIGCTMNRFILGEIKPAQGDVLYLALEDSMRRLQRRMTKLLPAGTPWPAKLTLKTEWRRLHEGGLEDIRAWHTHTKNNGGKPILVVIDVLAKIRKPVGNKQLYEADYEALTGLTQFAAELGLAIVVVHHTRKMASDDLMETVSGSFGVSGAADTILVMANKASGAVLDVRGRDVESTELAIEFSKESCRWRILGMAAEVHMSDQRARVLVALEDADEGLTVAEIAVAAQLPSRSAADTLLFKMVKGGVIERVKRGVYGLRGTLAKLAVKNIGKIAKKERLAGQVPDSAK